MNQINLLSCALFALVLLLLFLLGLAQAQLQLPVYFC